jgi:hypothetical protein
VNAKLNNLPVIQFKVCLKHMNASLLKPAALAIIRRYADGLDSAEAVAYILWQDKLTHGEPDPRAADVIYWSKELGWGIPTESAEEAMASARKAIERFGD